MIQIEKVYYHTTTKGSDGIDRVNVNVCNYGYRVIFENIYFDYDSIDELKENILNDIKKLQKEVKKLEKVK